MLASELFKIIEDKVPLSLALTDDKVGFIGPGHPDEIEVENVAVILDIHPETDPNSEEADLLVCHHPSLFPPTTPTYIIHSNWDIVQGGANDALADSLKLDVIDVLEEETGIGRICKEEFTLDGFVGRVFDSLDVDHIRIVQGKESKIEKIALISGFGLNPHYIKLASKKGVDLLLSGDLTHPGAVLAQRFGINLVDATHHATEIPGLVKLCQMLNELGLNADVNYTNKPWDTYQSPNMSTS
ncbi:Nif3-like dinuclear metal center hexameric protein [Methanobacterium petrolearium]|uniref:Nif3-like dinuclear metal center hexameric protein n=1 Tax=Methanobacterium petrolearium TaxID=710190 RepID=UPI001AE12A61|nr:Nif3-like dinuclear metal center hexameric protein [Methanobacterium petrolearium]MBP1946040.1 putative NIF3 family GTP cyclohydrolase 1 type 2 [Methanobacterium petrolearium]BDZ70825.1 Nif3-like dinuclear metal center hexameric protein [Methanobacterium petrolearium]